MNQIPQLQNDEPQMDLMRARSQVYLDATVLLVIQFGFTVLLPVATAAIALAAPEVRSYTAPVALLVSLLDVTWLDRLQRSKLKVAAKICEAFDCAVLSLPWDRFVAGKPADPETIAAALKAWGGGDGNLLDWYPDAIGTAPLHLARIICQRTNLWYDATLRRNYGRWVLGVGIGLLICLVIGSAFTHLTVELLLSTVLPPAAPVLIWSVREYLRQKDTAEAQETARGEAEALWERAKTGACAQADCTAHSREFQNAIYARRVSSPLMLPGIYQLLRSGLEDQMNAGAEKYLAELGL